MSGIAGYLGREKTGVLEQMAESMAHRGADDKRILRLGHLGFAHRRLSSIDDPNELQPMQSADERYTLVFNGEIYNAPELRDALEARLHVQFKTATDTEVVLESLIAWGVRALDRFDGMFAIAFWDDVRQELLVARDQFGIKPLYFTTNNEQGTFYFASEIKALLDTIEKPAPNDRVIYDYLRYRIHDAGKETFFDQIYRLKPGHYLQLSWNEAKNELISSEQTCYTDLRERLEALAEEEGEEYTPEVIAEFRAILMDSIDRRMRAKEKVGTSLSGGLDSSVVAGAVASKLRDLPEDKQPENFDGANPTFSAIFPNQRNNEEDYVDAVLEKHGDYLDPLKIIPDAEQFIVDLRDFIMTQEEPVISTGPYAQFVTMREASKYITVLLDGQGADEMMAGYNPHFVVYLRQLRNEGKWDAFFRELWFSKDIVFKMGIEKLKSLFRRGDGISHLLNEDFVKTYHNEQYHSTQDHLKKRLIEDIFENSLQALLRYEDRNTTRFALEGRVPFVQKDLVERIFKTSDEAIIKDGWNKRILRDAMQDVLPEKVLHRRKKIGFTTPEHAWFKEIRGPIYECFASQAFGARKYWNQHDVLEAFRNFMGGGGRLNTMDFWRILNVELWLETFIDDPDEFKEKPLPAWKPGQVNPGKSLSIHSGGKMWDRYPVRTPKVNEDTDLKSMILELLPAYLENPEINKKLSENPWGLAISEKIVAITQGRSYLIYEMDPGWWAKFLSRFVHRTPAGIGLGTPYTMQLAIDEVGLPRILLASAGAALGRLVGKKGIFYNIAGGNVRAIDGPTEYSVYPSNVSAKLPPKDPSRVAARLSAAVRQSGILSYEQLQNFTGFLVIDANDLGCNLLGSDTPLKAETYEGIFGDNPKGQGGQQTPLLIFVEHGLAGDVDDGFDEELEEQWDAWMETAEVAQTLGNDRDDDDDDGDDDDDALDD